MKLSLALLTGILVLAVTTLTTRAANVTFGSGMNQFTIEFVEIGNPGNAQDGAGKNLAPPRERKPQVAKASYRQFFRKPSESFSVHNPSHTS